MLYTILYLESLNLSDPVLTVEPQSSPPSSPERESGALIQPSNMSSGEMPCTDGLIGVAGSHTPAPTQIISSPQAVDYSPALFSTSPHTPTAPHPQPIIDLLQGAALTPPPPPPPPGSRDRVPHTIL